MTIEQRAELIADYIEAVQNKDNFLRADVRLLPALSAFTETYKQLRNKMSFTEAAHQAHVEAVVELLNAVE